MIFTWHIWNRILWWRGTNTTKKLFFFYDFACSWYFSLHAYIVQGFRSHIFSMTINSRVISTYGIDWMTVEQDIYSLIKKYFTYLLKSDWYCAFFIWMIFFSFFFFIIFFIFFTFLFHHCVLSCVSLCSLWYDLSKYLM